MSAKWSAALCLLLRIALFGFIGIQSVSGAETGSGGGSFKCFQCSSTQDPNCGDPFVAGGTLVPTECQDVAYVAAIFFTNTFTDQRLKHACIKTVKTGKDGKVSVERKCSLDTSLIKDSTGKTAPTMCDEDAKQTPGEECRICLEEGCNSAPASLSTSAIFVVSLATAILALRIFS